MSTGCPVSRAKAEYNRKTEVLQGVNTMEDKEVINEMSNLNDIVQWRRS